MIISIFSLALEKSLLTKGQKWHMFPSKRSPDSNQLNSQLPIARVWCQSMTSQFTRPWLLSPLLVHKFLLSAKSSQRENRARGHRPYPEWTYMLFIRCTKHTAEFGGGQGANNKPQSSHTQLCQSSGQPPYLHIMQTNLWSKEQGFLQC